MTLQNSGQHPTLLRFETDATTNITWGVVEDGKHLLATLHEIT